MSKENVLKDLEEVGSLPAPAAVEFKGKTFYVRHMSGEDRHAMIVHQNKMRDQGVKFIPDADLAALGLCTESGERVFTDLTDGAQRLNMYSSQLVESLAMKFIEINALSEKVAEKKSETSQN